MFAGFPNLAESESGAFYPGNIFIHLPGDFFYWYSVEAVVHFMVASAGFYTWMRQRGASGRLSAFLAATYSLTPFLVFHITAFGLFTSIVWLPWYFVILEAGLRGDHPFRAGLFMALFLGIMLMSGSVQAAFLGGLGLLLYFIGLLVAAPDKSTRKNIFFRGLCIFAPCSIAPFIAAVQIFPTWELTGFSERAATNDISFYQLGTWLNIPRLASLVIFPALSNPEHIQDYGSSLCFMGVVPFIFAVASVAQWRTSSRDIAPFLFVGIISLLLAFGLNLPGYTILAGIPPFSMFRYPGRAAHLALTFLLPVSLPALQRFESVKNQNNGGWVIGCVFGLVVVLVGAIGGMSSSGPLVWGSFAALIMTCLAAVLLLPWLVGKLAACKVTLFNVLLILSLAFQLVCLYPFSRVLVQERTQFDLSLEFFHDVKALFPTNLEVPRVLMPGSQYLLDPAALSKLGFRSQKDIWDNMSGNASGLAGVTAVNGLTPLNQNSWKEVLRDTLQSRIDTSLAQARSRGESPIMDELSLKIIRMLGTDVLLLEGSDWHIPGFEFWRDDLALPYHEGLSAYRPVEGWLPDAFFVRYVYKASDDSFGAFLGWLGEPARDVYSEAQIICERSGLPEFVGKELSEGRVIARERGFNWMKFEVIVEGLNGGFLVTGENWYPGWKAYVDETEVPYYRTDYLLSGIYIPSGEHTVFFHYQPSSVFKGILVSLLSLSVWICLVFVVKKPSVTSGAGVVRVEE